MVDKSNSDSSVKKDPRNRHQQNCTIFRLVTFFCLVSFLCHTIYHVLKSTTANRGFVNIFYFHEYAYLINPLGSFSISLSFVYTCESYPFFILINEKNSCVQATIDDNNDEVESSSTSSSIISSSFSPVSVGIMVGTIGNDAQSLIPHKFLPRNIQK